MRRGAFLLAVAAALGGGLYVLERERPAPALRRRPFPFAVPAVTRLEICNRHGRIRLERRGTVWWVTAPVVDRAWSEQVGLFLMELASLQTTYPLEAGHPPPALLARAGLSGGGEARFLIQAGERQFAGQVAPLPAVGARVPAAAADRRGIFTVSRAAARFLHGPVASFRDPRALRFDPSEWRTLELVAGRRRLRLAETRGLWRVLHPPGYILTPVQLDRLLTGVRRLAVKRWLGDSRPFPARRRIEVVYGLDAPRRVRLVLGPARPGGETYATAGGETFVVATAAVEALFALLPRQP